MKIIDLSQTISENTLVYEGDPMPKLEQTAQMPESFFRLTQITIGSHTATHCDAFSHFIENGRTVDEIDLSYFVGQAFVVDMEIANGILDSNQLKDKLKDKANETILIIRTGWEKNEGKKEFFKDAPNFSHSILNTILANGIKTIVVDTPSVEIFPKDSKTAHLELLGNEVVLIEGVVNLHSISKSSVFFSAAPLKIEGSDGSPVRAYAIEE